MSDWSYKKNVARGVTNAYMPTCYPAALERISEHHSLPPDIYKTYKRFVSWHGDTPGVRRIANSSYKEMINMMVWELGELTCDDVEFYAVDTFKEFEYTVRHLVNRECRVVLDIHLFNMPEDDGTHALGLLPSEHPDFFKLVSNHTPRFLQGLVTLETIFDNLSFHDEPPSVRYPFNDANITALPPID